MQASQPLSAHQALPWYNLKSRHRKIRKQHRYERLAARGQIIGQSSPANVLTQHADLSQPTPGSGLLLRGCRRYAGFAFKSPHQPRSAHFGLQPEDHYGPLGRRMSRFDSIEGGGDWVTEPSHSMNELHDDTGHWRRELR
jgi:hypothetical protein